MLDNETVNALRWTSPAVSEGMLYVRLSDGLGAYDLTGGRLRR